MIAVSHPTGNTFVRALVYALEREQLLSRFFTTLTTPTDTILGLFPPPLRGQLARRAFDLPREKITTHPLREAVRLLANAAGVKSITRHGGWASVDAVYENLDRAVASWIEKHPPQFDVIHCYEDGAEKTFRAAERAGIKRIYELPIAYWETVREILQEEAARLPEWEPTLYATGDTPEKLARKTREINLADVVVCPSKFVYDSLPETIRLAKKCAVAKFGSPAPPAPAPRLAPGKLRILFAGAMSQRKGLADLFAAMKLLDRPDIELVVLGTPILPMKFYREQFTGFIHEAPRPHQAVMQLMQSCDVLALPSLVEGRALVQQEALACGLPLVVSANAGAEDLVEEGKTGFLVPVRSPEKIAERIAWFADHRDGLPAMREAARDKAAQYSWDDYTRAIIEAAGTQA